MTLIVGTWWWGAKYDRSYIRKLRAGLERHLKQSFWWCIFEPEPEYVYLTKLPGCLIRLRMFDPVWQERYSVRPGDRLVCVDLDMIVTGQLDRVFDRDEDFVILQGANASNPCPYNGSVFMLRGSAHSDVWSDFSLEALAALPKHDFHDDQGWLAHKIPNAAGWQSGKESGIVAFQKPGWPPGTDLPGWAKLVAFPGWRDPMRFVHLPWVQEHWREDDR